MSNATSRQWTEYRREPCPICNSIGWCCLSPDGDLVACHRERQGCWQTKATKNGDEVHLHKLRETGADWTSPPKKDAKTAPQAADHDTRHAIYSAFLDRLTLSDAHRVALAARGLDGDEIALRGYRTLPDRGRDEIAFTLRVDFGSDLDTVPGFYRKGATNCPAIAGGGGGLLIPERDLDGRIVAIKVRPDGAGQAKYFYLSSTRFGGPSPGTPVHVPLGMKLANNRVRVTEGPLKADVAFFLSGEPTIAVGGVSLWRAAIPVLKAAGAGGVRLAFDADARTNTQVAASLRDAFRGYGEAGFAVEFETWDRGAGKGIDDVLRAGRETTILAGGAARDAIEAIAREAGVDQDQDEPRPAAQANGDGHQANGEGATGPPIPPPPGGRPEIAISTERHVAVEETIGALATDPDIYCRGESLVTVVVEADTTARLHAGVELRNAQGSPRIVTVDESYLACHVTKLATFSCWRKDRSGKWNSEPCHPPPWLTRGIANRKHWGPGIRRLMGIADIPFIRDGEIVSSPGYDARTGTLLRPSLELPPLPASPTRDDARDAAGRILAHVEQFPFAGKDDEAAWLAALLNAAARPAIAGPVPGTAINGNKAGCGKGLLVDVIGRIVWDRDVPTTNYPVDPLEAQKVKVAIALSGKPIVHFDNLEEGSAYGTPALDSGLTSGEIDDRILGTSKNTGPIPLRPCWFLSGNNIAPAKDAFRRWLICNLTTGLEHPEERDDIEVKDLRSHVSAHRAELVRDVLTILKAHADAGYPNGGWGPLGSFEAWDRVVRGAVWFATGKDCCATRKVAAEEAPERLEKLALLEAWRQLEYGGENAGGHTVDDAAKIALGHPDGPLHRAFLRRSRDGKTPDVRRMGNFIRGIRGTLIGGLKFVKAGEDHRAVMWRVEGTPSNPQPKGESDESGESHSQSGQILVQPNNHEKRGNEKQNGCLRHSPDSSDSPTEEPTPADSGRASRPDPANGDREVIEL